MTCFVDYAIRSYPLSHALYLRLSLPLKGDMSTVTPSASATSSSTTSWAKISKGAEYVLALSHCKLLCSTSFNHPLAEKNSTVFLQGVFLRAEPEEAGSKTQRC